MLGCRKGVHPGIRSLWEFHQAGGILGAREPGTLNQRWYTVVDRVNDHELEILADQLAPLRR